MLALPSSLLAEPLCVTRAEHDFNNDGLVDSLSILLTEGRRYHDRDMWEGAGEKYEGRFIVLVEVTGQTPVATNLNRLFYPQYETEQPMFFWCSKPWDIKFFDYNHDGRIDFNLSQYFSGVANRYRLFTVFPTGKVSELPLETGEDGFLGPKARVHSVETIAVTPDGFTCTYYSRCFGTNVRHWYRWVEANNSFVLAKHEREDWRSEPSDLSDR